MTDNTKTPSISGTEVPIWRSAKSDDLEMINRIADMIHVDLPERPEVFAEKLQLFPQGCFALVQNGAVVGYGVSHPWQLNSIPPLDTFLGALPASPECLFIHDVVVLPQARKFGASGELIKLLAGVPRHQGISFLALVSPALGTTRLPNRFQSGSFGEAEIIWHECQIHDPEAKLICWPRCVGGSDLAKDHMAVL
jgi:hypothetical protein